ncbi:hypothetical protein ACFU7T_37350 [Streptomyces sp. NPDC057555]
MISGGSACRVFGAWRAAGAWGVVRRDCLAFDGLVAVVGGTSDVR